MKKVSLVLFLALLMGGCGTKAKVYTLKPAEVSVMSSHKKIFVESFKGDRIGFKERLKTALFELNYNKTPYFELTYGKAQAIILGNISSQVHDDLYQNQYITHFDKEGKKEKKVENRQVRPYMAMKYYDFPYSSPKSKLDKKHLSTDKEISVEMCLEREVTLEGRFEIVADAKILYIQPFNESLKEKECSYTHYPSINEESMLNALQDRVIDKFINSIAPQKISYEIEVLSKTPKNYSLEEKEALKNALYFVEEEKYPQAEVWFTKLVTLSNHESFTALYNLGIMQEANGKYAQALQTYIESQKLDDKEIGLSVEAIERINRTQKMEIEAINEIEK